MEFEWDPTKNETNEAIHNITFEKAVEVFRDGNHFTEKTNRDNEERYKVIGLIVDKLFTVVYTLYPKGILV